MSDNITAPQPYQELFTVGDMPDGDGSPDCYFVCNICDRRVDDAPCPDHAPINVPGLFLVPCDATPRHVRVWILDFDTRDYGVPCMYCAHEAMQERVEWLERCRHWPWRRWKLLWRLASLAYGLGVIAGYGGSYGGKYGHHGCVGWFRWRGHRPYILGWQDWKWGCLLRQRHWPGVFLGAGCCSKCAPCPDCGSTDSCFGGACDKIQGPAAP